MDKQHKPCQLKIIFISALLIAITACSLKTIYNHLDYLIPSYVEGLVSLDDGLEKKLEQRTEILISWHRNTQLIEYADWLRLLQQDINTDLTTQMLENHIVSLEAFWKIIALKINQEMIVLLPLLSMEQSEELFESIDEKNEKYQQDYIDISEGERIEYYTERMIDTYENWFGELTDYQLDAIKKAASELQSSAMLRLQQRLLWQTKIRSIIDTADSKGNKSEQLRLFLDSFDINTTALKTINQFNRNRLARITLDIVRHLSQKQKDFFIDKTNEYIRIFTELSENR